MKFRFGFHPTMFVFGFGLYECANCESWMFSLYLGPLELEIHGNGEYGDHQ